MPHIVRRPSAKRDVLEIVLHLDSEASDSIADRFLESVESSFQRLAHNPMIGRRVLIDSLEVEGLRIWRIEGFTNWLIFYFPITDGVEIVRVIHGARDLPEELSQIDWE